MSHKLVLGVLGGIVLIIGTILVITCHHGPCPCFFHGSPAKRANWITKKISKELKLNDDQKRELDRIKNEIIAKHQEKRGTVLKIHTSLMDQLDNQTVSKEGLNQLFDDASPAIKDMRLFMVDKFVEFYQILTPEQKIVFAKKVKEHQRQICP
jgi:periplasmic protein CpxP/Spy